MAAQFSLVEHVYRFLHVLMITELELKKNKVVWAEGDNEVDGTAEKVDMVAVGGQDLGFEDKSRETMEVHRHKLKFESASTTLSTVYPISTSILVPASPSTVLPTTTPSIGPSTTPSTALSITPLTALPTSFLVYVPPKLFTFVPISPSTISSSPSIAVPTFPSSIVPSSPPIHMQSSKCL